MLVSLHAERRERGDLRRPASSAAARASSRDPLDEPDLARLVDVDRAPGEQQVAGRALADEHRESADVRPR